MARLQEPFLGVRNIEVSAKKRSVLLDACTRPALFYVHPTSPGSGNQVASSIFLQKTGWGLTALGFLVWGTKFRGGLSCEQTNSATEDDLRLRRKYGSAEISKTLRSCRVSVRARACFPQLGSSS